MYSSRRSGSGPGVDSGSGSRPSHYPVRSGSACSFSAFYPRALSRASVSFSPSFARTYTVSFISVHPIPPIHSIFILSHIAHHRACRPVQFLSWSCFRSCRAAYQPVSSHSILSLLPFRQSHGTCPPPPPPLPRRRRPCRRSLDLFLFIGNTRFAPLLCSGPFQPFLGLFSFLLSSRR